MAQKTNKLEQRTRQKETLASFTKISDTLYLMNYRNSYGLPHVLEKGMSNEVQMCAFLQRYLRRAKGVFPLFRKGLGCATFNAKTAEGNVLLGRNFDYKSAPCIVFWTAPEQGYRSIAITDANMTLHGEKHVTLDQDRKKLRLLAAPYINMDGMNEKGLAIAVLEIKGKAGHQRTGKKGMITTVMIRAVLDTCATVEEALELFRSYDMNDSLFCRYHFQICDAAGNSAIVEYVNNEMRIMRPGACEEFPAAYQYATNFFIQMDGDNSDGRGYDRYETIKAALDLNNGVVSEQEAMGILSSITLSYRHKWGHMVFTDWSAVYNCTAKTVTLCTGMDYDRVYTLSLDRPMEITDQVQKTSRPKSSSIDK